MTLHGFHTPALCACVLASALATGACGGSDRTDRNDNATASSAANKEENRPVTLAGCLQRGDGSDYILTQVNTPAASVGTTGSNDTASPNRSGDANAVGQEQLRAAAHSYRLSGEDDQFKNLVGHQVRVQGTLAAKSDLSHEKAGTAEDRPDIDEGDLAKVDVTSIESTAPACGTGANPR
jgi:hypothetical protein